MDKKILLILVAVIAILVVGAAFLMNPSNNQSKIDVLTKGPLHVGSTFQVRLAAPDNSSIANENVSFVVRDSSSNIVVNKSVKTNQLGVASLELDNVSEGQYTVNITFHGNDKFKNSTITHTLKVEAGSSDPVPIEIDNSTSNSTSNTTNSSSGNGRSSNDGSFYSAQSERTYYAGEIDMGPDGHHWKHIGNNEWVRID
ncbi:hypothetical protein [Methanobrevibacter sp.]|uniref:hypothetical protein n=1 Tax=Methanobrevibacter sp. TaxID=66852 RepID=UPI00388D5DE9